MAVIINADTSDGLKFVSDTSGTVDIQSNGTTKFSVGSTIDCQGNELVLDADADTSITCDTDDRIDFKTAGTDRMHLDSSGQLGIGTTSPSASLHINTSSANILIADTDDSNGSQCRVRSDASGNLLLEADIGDVTGSSGMRFSVDNSEAMRITSGGKVGIGSTSPSQQLSVTGSITSSGASNAFGNMQINGSGGAGGTGFKYVYSSSNKVTINNLGNMSVSGSLSKGSGSFKIDHPLPSKSNTHSLVHSFVEAPQADNIYRGKVALVGGTATINIDTSSLMTDGTFVLLNTDIQCFTTNETGWTSVKGSVSANTLTITAEDNTCTDTISWMVIGERKDQHMIDTDWTDENGKVIVEPLQEEE